LPIPVPLWTAAAEAARSTGFALVLTTRLWMAAKNWANMAANWPMLAALHLLLHSDRLFIGPETQRLPAILEASRRYQNEVSIRLAGQVLRALNELVRGFQEADRAAHGGILREALRHDPSHIYGGMLTTYRRMQFGLRVDF